MTSDQLRVNTEQHVNKSVVSNDIDKNLVEVTNQVVEMLKLQYPNYIFGIDKKVSVSMLANMVPNGVYNSERSFIKPDGGFVWVEMNGVKHYILCSEGKKQGTNDQRIKEGKKLQAKGNAIERTSKNFDAIEILFGNEDILPFVVFAQGCDFEDGSTINDRIATIAKFTDFNVINVFKKQVMKTVWSGGSFFVRGHGVNEDARTSYWTNDEMRRVMYNIANTSIKYFENKTTVVEVIM